MNRNRSQVDRVHCPEWHWFGRSLKNYQQMHHETARKKGVLEAFNAAPTLTKARKILFGLKKGATK